MNKKITSFENLRVWQKSHWLTIEIYKLTKKFPKEELYGIISQLRRAASSVPANIVEGYYRNTTKELIQYLYNARASSGEVIYFLLLSRDLKNIEESAYGDLSDQYKGLIKSINALISSLRRK